MHTFLRLATLALLLHANALFAQAISTDPVLNCGATEKTEALHLVYPAYLQLEKKLEQAWSAYAQKGRAAGKSNPPPFTLPIVFHIVHENGAENISNAAVERGLAYANEAFANVGYYDQGTGVNTQIQFCLARRDPDNNPTNGINRIVSPLTNLDSNDDRDLKDLSRWNTREYINVWVVKEICGLGLGCGVAGYAYYPSAHGSGIDGIVMEARWLAGDEAAAGVLIHELGHYLGLRHTFDGGCTNDDCTRDGDAVCDTPPDQSKAAVPCTGTANSCTTDVNSGFATDQNDMFINYMDYGHFRCYSAFTAGQRDRMHFFIDGIRRSLLESRGCQDPCPAVVTANFSGGDVTVDVGTTINFTNLSSNGDRYTWTNGNTIFSTTFNASFTFNSNGTYRITLVVESDDNLCQSATITQTVRVVCPVTASFDVPALVYVNVGDTLRNTSTNASTFRWTVDGTQVSTAEDYPFTFTATGLRRVCLETSNGLCGDNYCRSVFVREPPCTGPGCDGGGADDCGEAFAYAYEQPGGQAEGHLNCVVPATGGFFAAGDLYGQPLVMLINGDGTSAWQTQLYPPGFDGTVTSMIIDQNGLLAGIGFTGGDESPRAFAFQLDPADGSVIWANAYGGNLGSQAVGPRFTSIFHTGPSAPYTLLGATDQASITAGQPSASFFQLATADGALGAINVRYNDGSQSRLVDAVYDPTSALFYAVGSSSGAAGGSSPLLVALNAAGTVQWAKRLNDFNGGTTEGLSIDLDGGDLVVLATNAAANPATGKAFRLWKTDLLGNTTWIRQLTPSAAFSPERVRVHPNGYLLLGNNTSTVRQCLIQTDRDGNGLWAQAYDNQLGQTRFPADRLRVDLDRILLPTSLEPGFSVPALLRLGPAGNPPGECPQGGPLELEESQLQGRSLDQQLGTQSFQMEREAFFFEPAFLALNPESCRDTCPIPPPDTVPCGAPFFLQYTEADAVDMTAFSAVVPALGQYFVGGSSNGNAIVLSINRDGTINWKHRFDQDAADGVVTDLKMDSNGMIIGTADSEFGGLAFRINARTGEVQWARNYTSNPVFHPTTILERSPGGDFLVLGKTNEGPDRPAAGALFPLARTTGLPKATNFLTLSASEETGIADAVVDPRNGNVYTVTTLREPQQSRAVLTLIRPDNSVGWSRALWDFTLSDDTIPQDRGAFLHLEENYRIGPANAIVLVVGANPAQQTPFAQIAGQNFLVDITEDYTRRLTITFFGNAFNYRLHDFAYPPNSGPINLAYNELTRSHVLFTNISERGLEYKNWGPATETAKSSMATDESHVLIAGRNTLTGGPVLVGHAITQLGAEFCQPVDQETLTIFPVLSGSRSREELIQNDLDLGVAFFSNTATFGDFPLFLDPAASCQPDCPVPEICDNGIDDDDDGFVDCEDPDLVTDCCCLDSLTVDLGPDARLCPGELLGAQTNRSGVTYLWSTGATTDSIAIDQPGDYWVEVTDSCGNIASDTLTLHLRPRPNLQLGPDTVLCSNAVIPLLAQDGFASYEWVDGSTEKRFTAYDAGVYWVVATDSCGGVQRDTVRVSINPVTEIDLGRDTTICPGDTLRFQLSGFSNYQWSQSSFIDCTNCPEIRFAPTADTLLLVSADLGPGCISSDSIRVRIFPLTGLRDSAFLCPGDSVIFGENTLFSAGQYLAVQTVNGCERTDTLDVFELPETLLRDTVQACAGTAVDIFGSPTTQAGEYSQTFTAANGCDSTVVIRLEILETPLRSDTLRICQGDSVFLFGQFRRTAGLYEDRQTAANGCDSTHRVLLEVANLTISTRELNPDCGGAAAGAGEVLVNSNGRPFVVRWNTGDLTSSIVGLPAGDYSVTVTTDDGCSATETLTISSATFRPISIAAEAETCPGENDGILRISGGTLGNSYSLDGGTTVFEDSLRTGLAPGNYELWATDAQGCTQQLAFSVGVAAPLFINLPADQSIRFGDSVNVVPISNLPAGVSLTWGSSLGDSCRACPSLTLRPVSTVVVNVTMSDDRACVATDETTIRVLRDNLFYVPNAFSPNGDGVNDFFRIFPGPAVERILTLAVYDRWGGRVFLAEDRDPEDALAAWDGTLPGRDPNLGVYVYVVEVRLFTGEVVKEAGEVMVLR
ncbi:M43 family zinc metalloprotease [Neolewinella lacunae]|uniref:Gliding motility-associated C-terminal domain-containing protein n=1 Tax=Neolewinella lacunae TaxID=1517758 RepID=A0A923T636_9BACT|nr:M43 family zinc metalloprotease [Neolewinella lacunae]MBC6992995.1 gliding motility-associated C-terminal domain-containing protein [Neolewinella lacunae]MDN3635785.1 M43 family zinc metalloprotease [Neolewinella lacunae]